MTNGSVLDTGWRRLAAIAAATWVLWAVVVTGLIAILERRIEVFVLVFGLIPVAAWWATRWKPGRASYTVFGALGLAAILVNLPFLVSSLSHPESPFGFNVDMAALLAALMQTSVGVAVWAPIADRHAARIWQAAAAAFVVGLTASLIAAAALEDDEIHAGDVTVDTERVEFLPAAISIEPAATGVFIYNHDPVRHTFTVRGTGIDVELPANTGRRIDLSSLAPGTYEVICAVPGHENMTAMLTIER